MLDWRAIFSSHQDHYVNGGPAISPSDFFENVKMFVWFNSFQASIRLGLSNRVLLMGRNIFESDVKIKYKNN